MRLNCFHHTPLLAAGKLMTVFSAPDYPQFMAASEERYNNKGAVALLSAPTWAVPEFITYEAAPRPKVWLP
jgi:serine/threonine-protein phosphatase 5